MPVYLLNNDTLFVTSIKSNVATFKLQLLKKRPPTTHYLRLKAVSFGSVDS